MARPLQAMGGRKWYILEAFPPSYLPPVPRVGERKNYNFVFLFFHLIWFLKQKEAEKRCWSYFSWMKDEGSHQHWQHSASGWVSSAARRWLVRATHARHPVSINGGRLSVKRRCDAGRAPVVRPLPRHILLCFASRLIPHKDTLTTLNHPTLSESLTDNNCKLIKGAPDYKGQRVIISKIPMHTKQDTIGYLFKAELLYNLTCCVSSNLQYGTNWTFGNYGRLKCNWWRLNEIDLFKYIYIHTHNLFSYFFLTAIFENKQKKCLMSHSEDLDPECCWEIADYHPAEIPLNGRTMI